MKDLSILIGEYAVAVDAKMKEILSASASMQSGYEKLCLVDCACKASASLFLYKHRCGCVDNDYLLIFVTDLFIHHHGACKKQTESGKNKQLTKEYKQILQLADGHFFLSEL